MGESEKELETCIRASPLPKKWEDSLMTIGTVSC
jgi:hypothetical protein